MKKATATKPGSLASTLRWDRASSGETNTDLVVDSGSTDHIVVNKNWFESIRKIDTTVTNPEGGNTRVLKTGEEDVLAKHKRRIKPLILRKALFLPGYRTLLISVSSIIDNGFKVAYEKEKSFLSKNKENFLITGKGKPFFALDPKKTTTLLTCVGG